MARLSQSTYDAVREGAIQSAAVVLPLLARQGEMPSGVLDVGCGEGHWMRTATAWWTPHLHTVCGLDLVETIADGFPFTAAWDAESGDPLPMRGGPHPTETREVEGEQYPASADYRWPLTLCLEMAEHVSAEAGDHLIAELCRVSERVVFSAAIPGQGGDGHVNEQWPAYWGRRFNRHGFFLSDPWRLEIWEDERIEPWYRQNLLLAQPATRTNMTQPHSLVHPAVFQAKLDSAAWWREEALRQGRRADELLADAGRKSTDS
jgi:hypothetical protein